MVDIFKLKRDFLEYLEIEKGRSLKTLENYGRYLDCFLDFAEIRKPEQITENKIREFRKWLNRQSSGNNRATGETLKKKTQNYYLIALRVFLKFLSKRGINVLSPEYIELAKTGERPIDLISSEELARLIAAPEGKDLKSLRDRAILELLFSTGLRVSELCSLSRDINLRSDELSVRGKGEKIRVVFLSEQAKNSIKKYLDKRADMEEALFVKIGGRESAKNEETGLSRRSIERIVKYYAIKAGIPKKVTPHVIRHCLATDLLENGADLRSVQVMLGHASTNTTHVYTHVTDKHLKEIHRRFHGKNR